MGRVSSRKLRSVLKASIFFALLIYLPFLCWAAEVTPYKPGKPPLISKSGRVVLPSSITVTPKASEPQEATSSALAADTESSKPFTPPAAPPFAAYLTSLTNAANRLLALQNGDGGWAWDVTGSAGSPGPSEPNLYGVNALALLDAFRATANGAYLAAAVTTGTTLKGLAPADLFFPDLVFLYELSQLTGDPSYQAAGEAGILDFYTNWPSQAIIDDYYANRSALFGPNPQPFMAYDFAWTILAYATYAYVNVDYINRAAELLELAAVGQNPGVYKTQFQGAFLCGLGTDGLGNNYEFYWTGGQGVMLYSLQKLYPLLPSKNRSKCKKTLKKGLERLVMAGFTDLAQQGAFGSGWYSINGASLSREGTGQLFGYEAQAQAYALWALGYGMAPTSDYFYLGAAFAVNTQITAAPAGGWERAPAGYTSWVAYPQEYTEPDAVMARALYMAWAPKVISLGDLEPIFVGNPFGEVKYVIDFAASEANLIAGIYIYTTGSFSGAASKQISAGNWNTVLQAALGGTIYWRFRKQAGGVTTPSDTYEFTLLEVIQQPPFLIQLPDAAVVPAAPPATFSWLMRGNKIFELGFTNDPAGAALHTPLKKVRKNYINEHTPSNLLWNSIVNLEAAASPIYWWIKATDRLERVIFSATRTFTIP